MRDLRRIRNLKNLFINCSSIRSFSKIVLFIILSVVWWQTRFSLILIRLFSWIFSSLSVIFLVFCQQKWKTTSRKSIFALTIQSSNQSFPINLDFNIPNWGQRCSDGSLFVVLRNNLICLLFASCRHIQKHFSFQFTDGLLSTFQPHGSLINNSCGLSLSLSLSLYGWFPFSPIFLCNGRKKLWQRFPLNFREFSLSFIAFIRYSSLLSWYNIQVNLEWF